MLSFVSSSILSGNMVLFVLSGGFSFAFGEASFAVVLSWLASSYVELLRTSSRGESSYVCSSILPLSMTLLSD